MILQASGAIRGTVVIPGDKSLSHRALMLNGFASGRARVRGLLDSEDVAATARCMTALGATITTEDGSVFVEGCGGVLSEPADVLNCGNSGTTMRLLTGLLAGQSLLAVLTGDDSLRSRPMARVSHPLRTMGARIDGRADGGLAPLVVRGGALTNRTFRPAHASAQVKTALLLAGLQGMGTQTIVEPRLSRDHTERMLAAMGVSLQREGTAVSLVGGQRLTACDVDVPGDISSAAFFLVAASILPGSQLRLTGVGINPTRSGILDVLWRMGADITIEDAREVCGEPVADLVVRSAPLHGTTIGGGEIPRLIDELPVIAVAAAVASGQTTVTDAAELRVKESDRIATTVAMLRSFGARITPQPDGFVVDGGTPLHSGEIHPRGDHRIAMAGAVAGLLAGGTLSDPDCMAVSFPGFLATLSALQS
ncbi:MAG: 3-phosphoshikimate 1-carboxyvinyltransferase [Myxococcota bacterium]